MVNKMNEIELSNNALFSIVTSYNITDEEYLFLEIIMKESYSRGINGRFWLGPATDRTQFPINKEQVKILSAPLEDMPLYINSTSNAYSILSRWRLKIGR